MVVCNEKKAVVTEYIIRSRFVPIVTVVTHLIELLDFKIGLCVLINR